MSKSYLILFEGSNGVGKTTLAEELTALIQTHEIACEYLSSPGKVPGTLGQHVYDLHRNKDKFVSKSINPTSLQTLHIAAHIDYIENLIKPKMNEGTSIILDRNWWSTLVYGQVYGANISALNLLVDAEKIFWEGLTPDLTFLITRNEPIERNFNQEWIDIREAYKDLFKQEIESYSGFIIENEWDVETALNSIVAQVNRITNWYLPTYDIQVNEDD